MHQSPSAKPDPAGRGRFATTHVASLRARLTETPSELRQISDNVRTLCDDIGRQAMAPDPMVAPAAGGEAMETLR